MKMAFEASVLSYISMFFLSIGVILLQIVFTHNKAMQIEEYAIMMIEHHNRYDEDIIELIENKASSCKTCEVTIVPIYGNGELRYEVKVNYSINFTPLKTMMRNQLYALTTGVSS